MFVATGSGTTVVNLSHIVSIEHPRTGGRAVATLSDGRSLECAADLSEQGGTIVAAPPGHSEADKRVSYALTAVIAFRVLWASAPIPVTLQGEPGFGLMAAVIQPDGQCVGEGTSWDTLDDFKAACEREVAQSASPASKAHGSQIASINHSPSEPDLVERHRPETIEERRGRIQAEPIEALFADAPWRPGQDFVAVLDELLHAHPTLHVNGVGGDLRSDRRWDLGTMERERAAMMSGANVEAFEASLRFLSYAGRWFSRSRSRVNRERTSYSWKHAAERVMGNYVPNGMLIAAAYALGFTVEPIKDTANAYINLSELAISLDPGKGMT